MCRDSGRPIRPPVRQTRRVQFLVEHGVDLVDVFDDPDVARVLDLGELEKLTGSIEVQRWRGIRLLA
jgi:hypothetical protein